MKRKLYSLLSTLLIAVICFSSSACVKRVQAEDLMKDVNAAQVVGKSIDNEFIGSHSAFSLNLFKECIKVDGGKNTLISPLSISIALAMATNGANAQTREQMQSVLGGNIPIEVLNEYLYTYVNSLPNGEKYKVNIANSIWLRNKENFKINQSFLQTNANYYGAQIYKTNFNNQTVSDINNWVYNYTDGMIEKVVKKISEETIAYIINALLFEAEWLEIYEHNQVRNGTFTTNLGEEQQVKMMYSTEYGYVETNESIGLVKKYKDAKYAFVALLPNEGLSISDFIANLTHEELLAICLGYTRYSYKTKAAIPKFEYEYEITLNEILKQMGMADAFDPDIADFTNLGTIESYLNENIYINNVLHKTHISVAEKGTKAGAVTVIEMNGATSAGPQQTKYVYLDRPFVYMIVDTETYLPLFIGSVESVK